MNFFADQLLVLVMLINLVMLGTSRLIFSIRAVAVQGVILGILPGLIHPFSGHLAAITVGIILAKGIVIPYLISDAVRKAQIRREVEPFIGYVPTLLLGAVFTALAFAFAEKLPLAPEHQGSAVCSGLHCHPADRFFAPDNPSQGYFPGHRLSGAWKTVFSSSACC